MRAFFSWLSPLLLLSFPLVHCASERGADDEDLAAATADPTRAQMNDVSVLYPLAQVAAEEKALLAASAKGPNGALLPKALYDTTLGFGEVDPDGQLHPGQDTGLYYPKLRLVAFRLDPCFAQIGPVEDVAKCDNQLRVIFQTIHAGVPGDAVDGAIHVFYRITRAELTSALEEVIALRIANGGTKRLGPLGVHPIMKEQSLTGAMAKGLNDIVLKYGGEKNLMRFTAFTPAGLATTWDFRGFDVANGKATAMKIPTLPKGGDDTSVRFFKGFSGFSGSFTPETTSKDDMQIFGNLATAKAASKAEQQSAFDASVRIDNPDFHSPDTIDCASCHVASVARVLVGEKELKLKANPKDVFFTASKYVLKSELKSATPVNTESASNFHAFSYRFTQPMVNQRTVNETASVVAYVNESVLPPAK